MKKNSIVFMSTYPPRECGIATFTEDLATAVEKEFSSKFKSKIIAMDNSMSLKLKYPKEVIFHINEINIKEYIEIAKKINKRKDIKLINIQHEFGIFGGKYLNYLSAFLETIKKPVVTSMHSVAPNPPESIKSIIQYLAKKSKCLVVMNKFAVDILRKEYGVKNTKIEVIHHGIHEVAYEPSKFLKKKLGYEDKLILSSFGLITGGKSYEDIIKAMPTVVKKFPSALYLIIGATHPGILKKDGEKYRDYLKKLIKKFKLNNNVKFVNKYLSLSELLEHLKASDIFVSSGKGLHQIVSGTLSYAMGCGRPVITIPFLHAKEAVSKNRGILVKLNDPKSFSKAIIKLLSNPKLREKMGENAYAYTRHMVWHNAAKSYMKVFKKYM
jgi:glycosyltransferase involved in cell wall biosynthesis